ncbi:MAG: response regulator, partial [Planctomycetes bacterium]|nr:response regulator [Planctomycetota bacterium]
MRVLIVEDYAPLRGSLAKGLREAGYAVDVAADGEVGLWHAIGEDYDTIVLDLMLPKLDGLTVLERIRQAGKEAPVLILTARDAVKDRVRGLEAGADDYLVKPFALEELLARVQALCRRAYGKKQTRLAIDDLVIDTLARAV